MQISRISEWAVGPRFHSEPAAPRSDQDTTYTAVEAFTRHSQAHIMAGVQTWLQACMHARDGLQSCMHARDGLKPHLGVDLISCKPKHIIPDPNMCVHVQNFPAFEPRLTLSISKSVMESLPAPNGTSTACCSRCIWQPLEPPASGPGSDPPENSSSWLGFGPRQQWVRLLPAAAAATAPGSGFRFRLEKHPVLVPVEQAVVAAADDDAVVAAADDNAVVAAADKDTDFTAWTSPAPMCWCKACALLLLLLHPLSRLPRGPQQPAGLEPHGVGAVDEA